MTDEETNVEETTEVEESTEEMETSQEEAEESQDGDDSEEESSKESPEDKIARLTRQNKQLRKKLEKPPSKEEPKKSNPSDFFEERIELIAAGEDKNIVSEAAIIAKAKGISLTKAMADPLITSYKKEVAAQKKSDEAALGASGKSVSKDEPTFKPGMTRDEHKKAWQEANQ